MDLGLFVELLFGREVEVSRVFELPVDFFPGWLFVALFCEELFPYFGSLLGVF